MKALGLVVSDKKIFENCILKTYFLTMWPTYATNQNYMNNFRRGAHRDHSCEVWSKSNEWFQRRRCLSKKVYGRRTTTDDGQRPVTIAHPEHFVLRWAKKLTKKRVLTVAPISSFGWLANDHKHDITFSVSYSTLRLMPMYSLKWWLEITRNRSSSYSCVLSLVC